MTTGPRRDLRVPEALAHRQERARGLARGARSRALVDDPWLLRHLRSLAAGESADQAARRLYVSVDTVKTARRFLYRVLQAVNGPQAVALGFYLGLLDPDLDPRVPEPGDPPVERLPDADVVHVWEHRAARAHLVDLDQPQPVRRRQGEAAPAPGEPDPASWRGLPLDEIRRRWPTAATGQPRPEDRTPRD